MAGESAPRWALVLGASAGTGAAVCVALARAGYDIFGVHRGNHPEGAAAVAASVAAVGRRCHWRVADGGTHAGALAGARELLEVAGSRSVAVVVHSIACASVARLACGSGPLPAHPKQVAKTFEAMAHSFVWWTQALLDGDLLGDGARLIGLTNPMVDQVLRGTALVAASKAALEVYVRHLAHELGPLGHRVNLLKFGAVPTHALRATVGDDAARAVAATAIASVPAGRLVTVEEVARFIAVLAGPAGAWFNGATIDMTGGETQALYDHAVAALLTETECPPLKT